MLEPRRALWVVSLFVLIAGCEAPSREPQADGEAEESGPPLSEEEIAGLTKALVEHEVEGKLRSHAAEMTSLAQRRHAALVHLMRRDPAAVGRHALPDAARRAFPPEVSTLLERSFSSRGSVEVTAKDFPDREVIQYWLSTPEGERFELHFARNPPELTAGDSVQLSAVAVGRHLAVSEEGALNMEVSAAESATSLGEQRVVVILANFQDNAARPFSAASALTAMQTVSDYYWEASFEQTWITTRVTGWYTLPISGASCPEGAIFDAAIKAADPDVFFPDYDRVVVVFPSLSSCGWTGSASVRAGGFPTADGTVDLSYALINGTLSQFVLRHELGHNLGVDHATALDCGAQTLGTTCTTRSYGDPFDTMGNIAAAHFNLPHKRRLAFFAPLNLRNLEAAGTSTHVLKPIELESSGTQGLLVLKDVSGSGSRNWYYVEARKALGFDAFLSANASATSGALVHFGGEVSSSTLLDMTPGDGDFLDAALPLDRTFSDAAAGVSITTVSSTPADTSVRVTLAPDTLPPTVGFVNVFAGAVLDGMAPVLFPTNVKDNRSISEVALVRNGLRLASSGTAPFQVSWDTRQEADGSTHTLVLEAADASGNRGSTPPVTIRIDSRPPTVAMTSPAGGAEVSGIVTLRGSATDTLGVNFVLFLVDNGDAAFGYAPTAPFEYVWDTRTTTDGYHTIVMEAYDPASHKAVSVPVTVRVRNTATPLADLTVSSLTTGATAVAPGSSFALSNRVTNQGAAGAGSFQVGFRLRSGSGDVPLSASRALSSLAAQASNTASTNVAVPASLAPGSYSVCATADSGGVITESMESNNERCAGPIQVVAGDLTVGSLTGPSSLQTGVAFDVSTTVRNIGVGTVTGTSVGIYLSTDATITTGDVLIGTRSIASVAGGATSTGTTRVVAPASLSPGTYHLGALADYGRVSAETNEGNNTAARQVAVASGVNLALSSVNNPSSAYAGSQIVVSTTVMNSGVGAIGRNFYLGIYLSTDPTITTTDTRLTRRGVPGLAAGALSSAGTTVTLPSGLAPGTTYYVGAIADYRGEIAETNEADNARVGSALTIGVTQ